MTAEQRALFDALPILDQEDYFDIHGYNKRPEIFPGTDILAVNNNGRVEELHWTIEDRDASGVSRKVINAKAETVAFAKMFKEGFRKDRVLIPATAIFEWQKQERGDKQKYEIWFDEPVFAFAGIARECEIKGEKKRCGVILTTTANEVFAKLHNMKQRQAVVIRKPDHERWLDPDTPFSDLKRMLEPLRSDETHYKPAEDTVADEASQGELFSGGAQVECDA